MKAYLVTLRDCDPVVVAAERAMDAVVHAVNVANAHNIAEGYGGAPLEIEDLEQLQEVGEFDGVAAMATDLSGVTGSGSARIASERCRQIVQEGWTDAHDDEWVSGELAAAAACYAIACTDGLGGDELAQMHAELWPFEPYWWKPGDGEDESPQARVRRLEKAGALISAEIDRLLRRLARGSCADDEHAGIRCGE